MSKYLDIDGLRILWAQITNKIGQQSNATAEALEGKADLIEGKIPASQLPSYVDDVLEYANKASFPATGETGKIYLDLATNLAYRWGGTAYTEISPSLALGTTSSTAYRGDYGAAAYKHAVTNKGIAKSSGLYKITTNAEGHVTAATAVVKADITGLGIPAQDTTYENATTTTNGLMSSTDKTKLNSINLSALVKSVNGITPDSNGNVAIEVGGTVSEDYLPLSGGTLTGGLDFGNTNNAVGWTYSNGQGWYVRPYVDNDQFQILKKNAEGNFLGYFNISAEGKISLYNPLSIDQGGTGATDAATALTNLGGRKFYTSVEALGLTAPATISDIYKAMPSHSSLVLQSAAYAQIAEADSPAKWGTFTIDKAYTYGHATCVPATSSHAIYDAYFYQSSTTADPTFSGWKQVITENGGTITGTLTINNSNSTGGFVALMEDNEGGTIQIGSKTGAYTYEIDAYNDEILRVHTAVKNPNGDMKSLLWNGRTGNLTADGFTGSWLGNTIGIDKGGTGATTAATACVNLGAVKKSGDTMTGILYRQGGAGAVGLAIGTASKPENVSIISVSDGVEYNRFSFRQYGSNGNRENFNLPNTTTPSANVNYDILTTKSPVTVAQGGTGGSTSRDALNGLGLRVAPYLGSGEYTDITDLNDLTLTGLFQVAGNFTNAPLTNPCFILNVKASNNRTTQFGWRSNVTTASKNIYMRRQGDTLGTWDDWEIVAGPGLVSEYLPLSGGTLTGTTSTVLSLNTTNANNFIYIKSNDVSKVSIGYYNGLACIANEATLARIGVNNSGTPQYWSNAMASTAKTLLHEGNYGSYIEFSNLKDIEVVTSTPTSITNGKWYLVKQG